jgi:hypothetical protein
MASTIREVIIKARMDASRSQIGSGGFANPAASKMALRDEQKLAATKELTAAKVASLAAKDRRAEEIHVARMEKARLAAVAKEAAARNQAALQAAKAGAYQGEVGAKDVAKNMFGDRGNLIVLGTTLGVGFVAAAGPAMKALASEIAGRGGPFSNMAKEFWAGGAELAKAIVDAVGGDGNAAKRGVEKDGLRIAAEAMFPGLSLFDSMLKDDPGYGAKKPGEVRTGQFGGFGTGGNQGFATQDALEQGRLDLLQKSNSLLEAEQQRLQRLATTRANLIQVETDAIKKNEQLIQSEKAKIAAGKVEFGMLSLRDRERATTIAKQIKEKGFGSLTQEQSEFAQSKSFFRDQFEEQARKNAEAAGGADLIFKGGTSDKKIQNALQENRTYIEARNANVAKFDIENKIDMTVNFDRLIEGVSLKLLPLKQQVEDMINKKIKDEADKLQRQIAAGAPQGL